MSTEKAHDTKEAILDAAERLLARYGYKKTTMEDVAKEAGIGKGTTYLHFQTKEDVFLGTVDRIVDRLVGRLEAIGERKVSATERLGDMLVERVMFRFDSVQMYPQSLNEIFAALRPAFLTRRARQFDLETTLFSRVLRDGCATGEFAVDDPETTARDCLVATNALLPYSLSTDELGARDEVHDRASRIAGLLLNGLRKGL